MVFYMTAVMTIGPRVIWKKTKQNNQTLNIYQDQVIQEETEKAASLDYKHLISTLIGNYGTAGMKKFKQTLKINIKMEN